MFLGTVKIAKDTIFQELEGEAVLLNMQTGIYFGLNSMGSRIWQLLSEHSDVQTVGSILLGEFDIREKQLQNHLSKFIETLKSKGLIEVNES